MNKTKLIILFAIFCSIIMIPCAFAHDNETAIGAENIAQDSLSADYYFDSNNVDSGNGSQENPYKDIKSKDHIKNNSVLHLKEGEYSLAGRININNVTIIGENPSNTIVNCKGAEFTVVSSLTLRGVTFVKLGITNNGNLTAVNSIFKNSTSGMIKSTSGMNVNIYNCTFTDNFATNGGVINMEKGSLTIQDSTFNRNHATNYGGIIALSNNAIADVTDSKFMNSYSADDAGGAFYLRNSTLNAANIEIINCSATFGGAITSLHSTLNLNNLTARNNRARYDGGAIYAMYRYVTMTNSLLDNNSANNGGALFIDSLTHALITSNKFTNNHAENTGGAIYRVFLDDYLPLTDKSLANIFSKNSASNENDDYESDEVSMVIGNGDYIFLKSVPSFNGTIPSSYDLRQLGYVTPVRNQGNDGNCWAFTSLASLESAILKITGTSYDLSEENMKNIMSLYSDYGWFMDTNAGGYDKMGVGYLTGWMGPVNETDDVYKPQSVLSTLFNSFIHVQNILFFKRENNTDNDAIKRAIIDYGAVGTCIYWNSAYLTGQNYYCYSKSRSLNHAVAIVGWDDNYSRYNFKTTPEGDGAWIVKNSWGTGGGDKGFFYVSYYDTQFAQVNKTEASFAFVFNESIRYDKNYQYDIPGKTDYLYSDLNTIWYKNKFVSTEDEYLAAVSTYFQKNTKWNLSVYINGNLNLTKSGFAVPSYSTIELGRLIPLHAGDVFEVEFEINVDGDVYFPISDEQSLNHEFYTSDISFVSYDGVEWLDLYDLQGTSQVACIKAFTVVNPIPTLINLTLDNINNNHADLIAEVHDIYGNLMQGNVTFNISGNIQVVNLDNGIAKVKNIALIAGINKFTAEFSRPAYNSSSSFVLYSKVPVETEIALNFTSRASPMKIVAFVNDNQGNPVETGEVTFNITEHLNETNDIHIIYTAPVIDGEAFIIHDFICLGVKEVYATYDDLYCYKSSKTNASVTLTTLDSQISLSFDQYNPVLIMATVLDEDGGPVSCGNVIFTVEGTDYTIPVNEGMANLSYLFESQGWKVIKAAFVDDTYFYTASNTTDVVNVALKPTDLTLSYNSTNNPVLITATVKDMNGEPVANGFVRFNISGYEREIPVEDGIAEVEYVFETMGMNSISAVYLDSYYYLSSNSSVSLDVSKIPVYIGFSYNITSDNVNFIFTASKPIDEILNVNINGVDLMYAFDNGHILIKNIFSPGTFKVKAYMDSLIYESNNISVEFKVPKMNTTLTCGDEIKYASKSMIYKVTLQDQYSRVIPNAKVSITIGDKVYSANTNILGVASININSLAVGSYDAEVSYSGNQNYQKSVKNVKFTIKSTIAMPDDSTYTYNSPYAVTLYDSDGKLLKNTEASITVGGATSRMSTNQAGVFSYNIVQNPGYYSVVVNNLATGEQASRTIFVTSRIVENSDVNMYFGAGSGYTVRVLDDHGNPLGGANVIFTINGNSYGVYSDWNGYASYKISLNPGTYSASASYKGFTVSNSIVVKKTLITKNVKVKKGKTLKFTAKLLNTNGKVLKNKYVKFKFKGKTYKAKTNKKGIATLKLSTKKFKARKYSIVTSYGKAKVTNKITVKK